MMGQQPPQQNALFYDFCLARHIPSNHLLRHIDSFLDFSEIRKHPESFYSHTGRPSIDPELMIRILLIGYCNGIRSERRLCEEINFNLAYRWFCGLGLEAQLPDHSTFSKNRHGRFRESDLFRMVFNTVVRRCMKQVWLKVKALQLMRVLSERMHQDKTIKTHRLIGLPSKHKTVQLKNIWNR